jgi:hypothetical protein
VRESLRVKKVTKIEKLTSKFSRKLSRGMDEERDVLIKNAANVLELAIEEKASGFQWLVGSQGTIGVGQMG